MRVAVRIGAGTVDKGYESVVRRANSKNIARILFKLIRPWRRLGALFGLLLAVGIGYTGGFIMLAMMAMIGVGVALGIGKDTQRRPGG